MSGGVDIDIDRTALLMMAIFAVLVVLLKPLMFDPILQVFEEREKRTEGAKAEARAWESARGLEWARCRKGRASSCATTSASSSA